jgi:hypothetical protein
VQAGGGTAATSTDILSTNTLYHVWLRHVVGTGADEFASAEINTTGIRSGDGTDYVKSEDGTGTDQATRLYLQAQYNSASTYTQNIFDKVLVKLNPTVPIGSNP